MKDLMRLLITLVVCMSMLLALWVVLTFALAFQMV